MRVTYTNIYSFSFPPCLAVGFVFLCFSRYNLFIYFVLKRLQNEKLNQNNNEQTMQKFKIEIVMTWHQDETENHSNSCQQVNQSIGCDRKMTKQMNRLFIRLAIVFEAENLDTIQKYRYCLLMSYNSHIIHNYQLE